MPARSTERILGDSDVLGDLVGGLEADAVDVFGQHVRIVLDLPNRLIPIRLIDPHGLAGADSVAVEEEHDFTDLLALLPSLLDPLPALRSDAFHRFEFPGAVLDHGKDVGPKSFHHPLGEDRANPLDHSAAQILLNSFCRIGRHGLEHRGFQLESVFPIPGPRSFGGQPLAGTGRRKGADDADEIAVPVDFHLEDRKAGFFVEVGNPLNQAGELVGWLR